jgi:hypothetical protein
MGGISPSLIIVGNSQGPNGRPESQTEYGSGHSHPPPPRIRESHGGDGDGIPSSPLPLIFTGYCGLG